MTPIKTGAWVLLEQHQDYYRCDLYEVEDTVLIARINPRSRTRVIEDEEGVWATMHDYHDFDDHEDGTHTVVSDDYTVHYMMQFMNGKWHNVRLT